MDPLIKREVISSFNDKPKDGISKIKEWCASNNKDFAEETAKFFREEKNNLDLVAVGDYLGTDGEDNKKVLDHFVKQFDFKDKNYLKSLREFLKAFKLPGEAQKIDRLVESFGFKYHEQNLNGEVKSNDAAYILAYQTIMLNTDLHSPSIAESKKMTFEQLKNNLRGTNENQNFSDEFLKKLYDGIKAEPFELNFIQTATGYEIAGISSQNDKTFKKLDDFLTAKTDIKNVFSNLGNNVTAEHKQPKTWLNKFTGYEGSVSVKAGNAEVEIQVYKPNILSKWFLGEKSKLVIQPKGGSEQSLKLAAQIAASFDTKVTSIKATYDYLKQDLENYYKNPEQELRKANSVADLHNQIKETTAKVQQVDPEIPDTKSIPLASETNFQDLKQAEIGIQPAKTQPVEKPKFNTFAEELAWKNAQKKQAINAPVTKNEEPKTQIDNHKKRLEELKQKQEELENKKKELEEKKADSNTPKEEKWKIGKELDGISKQLESIKRQYDTINTAEEREKQFNKSSQSADLKGEPTAADLQLKGGMAAIQRRKEQIAREEAASKAIIANNPATQPLKPGVISPPPPPPPGKGAPIPPPPPPPMPGKGGASPKPSPMPAIPPKLQETLKTIHTSQDGNKQQGNNNFQDDLRKTLARRNSSTR
ncbi:MAG TPA: T4SS guanine nucleotide exchange effector RalF [Rickettsia endosymbiont of Bembidion lapponicum]|nr:T4SS guanine nucleotide exchange effector RalF [Rickettsia endosymbiont of Bembidion lapponicum]